MSRQAGQLQWAVHLALATLDTVDHVALLAPYRPHVHLMTALVRDLNLRDRVTVGTIHWVQGAEAAAVIVDLVDAPPLGVPGRPLSEPNGQPLVNVALSRAKGKLLLLGDPRILKPSEDFRTCGTLLQRLRASHGWDPDGPPPGIGAPILSGAVAPG